MKISEIAKLDSVEMFAEWLWQILCAFYPKLDWLKFGDLENFVTRYESSVIGLAEIYYEHVPDDKKPMFRKAIGELLHEKSNDEKASTGAMEDLVYLIARIKALESAMALSVAVGTGLLGKRYPEILDSAFASLEALSPSKESCEATLKLINSENFDTGYFFSALEILIRYKPSEAASIIKKHLPDLIKLKVTAKKLGAKEWEAYLFAKEDFIEFLERKTSVDINILKPLE
ncbi:MAG: hypothetical protein ABIG40_03175 [Parcubacteria group bacterium]